MWGRSELGQTIGLGMINVEPTSLGFKIHLDFGRLVIEMWHGGIMKTGGKLIFLIIGKSLSSNFKVNFTTLMLQ